jgi:cobalamin biosynthesis protein CobT
LYKAKTPPCHVDDCSISIKLSSTVFRSDLQTGDSEVAAAGAAVDTADQFFFDKNGAVIPYPALRALLFCEDFLKYMEQIKSQFEEDTGSKVWQETDDDNDDDDDDKKGRSKNGKKNSAVGKNSQQQQRQQSAEEEEEEEEEGGEEEEEEVPPKIKKTNNKKK